MARRNLTFVALLPVLAACSTTASVDLASDSAPGSPVYLDGKTTQFAVCAEELPEARRPKYNSLRNAVIAGDASMTAAASLFMCDGVYVLDLVLCNHGDGPFDLDRSQIKLYDGRGIPLEALPEWAPGAEYGLRAERTTTTAYEILGNSSATRGIASSSGGLRKGETEAPGAATSGAGEAVFQSELRVVQEKLTLPRTVTVTPQHHVPYWAYWRASEVEGPLRVKLRVGNRRMVMDFEVPQGSWAR